jgi:hypothetical protein
MRMPNPGGLVLMQMKLKSFGQKSTRLAAALQQQWQAKHKEQQAAQINRNRQILEAAEHTNQCQQQHE